MLENWDRSAFIAFMRRIEILLMQNLHHQAMQAFRMFVAWTRPEPPTMDSAVHDVLPLRIANKLEEYGYETLRAACMATPQELQRIDNVGEKSIEVIRIAARAAQQGKRLPEVVAQWAAELQPEFEIDWEYFAQFEPKWNSILTYINTDPERQTMSNVSTETAPLNNQLSILLKSIESPEQTVAQIDAEIAKREAELGKLKKLRKLLGAKPTVGNSEAVADIEAKIVEAVKDGPLKPKDIKKLIRVDAAHIGRIVARSSLLVKLTDGRIKIAATR